MEPRVVWQGENLVGESPLWDYRFGQVCWIDIEANEFHVYEPSSGDHICWPTPCQVSAIGLREKGGYVAATEHGIAIIDPTQDKFERITHPLADKEGVRFNDGKVDKQGGFWAGTCRKELDVIFEPPIVGELFHIDWRHQTVCVEKELGLSNGIGWSPDGKTFYLTDSVTRTIYAYDYDAGSISNRRPLIVVDTDEGRPDGLTVDKEGHLWVALWDGGCINRYHADGTLAQTIKLPVATPTSCCFGGPSLSTLYITTAGGDEPLAGSLFALDTPVKGFAEPLFFG